MATLEIDTESDESNESDTDCTNDKILEEKNIFGLKQKHHSAFCVFILVSMSIVNFVINKFIYIQINPLKILLSITPLLYFNFMFLSIIKTLK